MHQTSTGTKKKQKRQKFQQLLRIGPIVPGNFSFFWVFFGACAGLVTLTSQNIDGHQKNKTTKPLDAPHIDRHQKKQKFQQLLRSPGNSPPAR